MSVYPAGLTYRPIVVWPGQLTKNRRRSQFSSTLSATLGLLTSELAAVGARSTVLQIAITESELRNDGLPRANAIPQHPGVILSFETPNGSLSFPSDAYTKWQDNLRAVAVTLQDLRRIERHGVVQHGEQYAGWRQIEARPASEFNGPGGAMRVLFDAAEMIVDPGLDVAAWSKDDRAVILRKALFKSHPDQGGSADAFDRVMRAQKFLRDAGEL